MRIPDDPRPGDPIRPGTTVAILECLRELERGFPVAAPLAFVDGVLVLANPFKVSYAVALGAIPNRQGLQLGKGQCVLYAPNADGLLAPRPGFPVVPVLNDRGIAASTSQASPIPDGTLIKVYYADGAWNVFNGDCVGASIVVPADSRANAFLTTAGS